MGVSRDTRLDREMIATACFIIFAIFFILLSEIKCIISKMAMCNGALDNALLIIFTLIVVDNGRAAWYLIEYWRNKGFIMSINRQNNVFNRDFGDL